MISVKGSRRGVYVLTSEQKMETPSLPEVRAIATGAFGRVYAARLASGNTVAIKCTRARGVSEYRCLCLLGHARIPHTISAIAALRNAGPPLLPEPCELAIAMTHVHGTTLREHLIARAILGQPMDMALVRQWTAQLVDFLLHIQVGIAYPCWIEASYHFDQVKLGLSHDDLKLGNIMVENQRELKIVDFTFAGPKPADEWHCGTLCYMPPERLFYTTRPPYATLAGPDIWAVGVLLSTLTLTAQPLGNMLTAREAFLVTDEQGRFDPSRTNTVYDLVSDREAWFANAAQGLAESSGLDVDLIKQGIRLILWCRARLAEGQRSQFRLPPVDDASMIGFGSTPLCRLLSDNLGAIVRAYDETGSKVYERVWEHMRQRMGEELYSVWRGTQNWSPRTRGTLDELQRRIGIYPGVSPLAQDEASRFPPPLLQDRVDLFIDVLEQ